MEILQEENFVGDTLTKISDYLRGPIGPSLKSPVDIMNIGKGQVSNLFCSNLNEELLPHRDDNQILFFRRN